MLEQTYRTEWARLVAALTRRFGSLDVAEDAAADAFAVAAAQWGEHPPVNPGGWLMTTATRRAIDRLRRERRGAEKLAELARDRAEEAVETVAGGVGDWHDTTAEASQLSDDRLALIFTCAHPALSPAAQLTLILRLVVGLSVEEIARGLLSGEAAVGQRITRAKAKIAAANIPFRVPPPDALDARLDTVLSTLYVLFNEGYLPGGAEALRPDLCREAIRLGRLLAELLPDAGEVSGLLALMLMSEARRPARVSADGALVPLEDQDRSRWDGALVREGHALVRARIATGIAPGRFQLQAAIAAVHTHAPDLARTDWPQIEELYRQLARLDPGPVVALNRAVVQAELDGPAVGLAAVEALKAALDDYHAFHVARASLLDRLGRRPEAVVAYDRAIALAENPAEQRFLRARRDRLATA